MSNIIKKYEPKKFIFPKRQIQKWKIRETFSILYGLPGCGKTTEIAKLSKELKILILDFDRGGSVGKDGVAVQITDTDMLFDVINSLTFKQFDVVVIDSVDLMEEMIDTKTRNDFGLAFSGQVGYGKDWMYQRALLADVFDVLSRKGSHILISGHAINKEIKDENEKPFSQIQPAAREKVFNSIGGRCVSTIYMKAVGRSRYLFSKQKANFYAKDRTGLFPDNIKVDINSMDFCNIYVNEFKKEKQ